MHIFKQVMKWLQFILKTTDLKKSLKEEEMLKLDFIKLGRDTMKESNLVKQFLIDEHQVEHDIWIHLYGTNISIWYSHEIFIVWVNYNVLNHSYYFFKWTTFFIWFVFVFLDVEYPIVSWVCTFWCIQKYFIYFIQLWRKKKGRKKGETHAEHIKNEELRKREL